ncbi:MAG TPA: histidine--tRNA ligase [Acidobacteriota bacterium]|nr:histidine--tRNA ligase [Acidobacteriota bacterium]
MAAVDNEFQRLLGTADLLPEESARWVTAENTIRATMRRFGFGEIRVPIMEPTPLFDKGTGASTDIVQKEMYTFTDRGNRSITLRPEGTPSVVRAYLEASLSARRPTWKLFYIGPMFRAERPQQGRYRQFHQYGAEMIGPGGPEADIELIALGAASLADLGITDVRLVMNSIGAADSRRAHNAALRDFLKSPAVSQALCEDCKRRTETNPLRVFDCKKEPCAKPVKDAPTIDAFLTPEDRDHFAVVRDGLERLGIPYAVDVRMVRGLDYYTRTTFEFKTDKLGAQDALLGGGRYDGLVELYGGPPTPAVGFAAGIERILAVIAQDEQAGSAAERLDVFVCALGAQAAALTPVILAALRALNISADRDFMGRGLKAQMKEANRLGARRVLIVGDDEIARGQYVLRLMDRSEQTEIPADPKDWTADLFRKAC